MLPGDANPALLLAGLLIPIAVGLGSGRWRTVGAFLGLAVVAIAVTLALGVADLLAADTVWPVVVALPPGALALAALAGIGITLRRGISRFRLRGTY